MKQLPALVHFAALIVLFLAGCAQSSPGGFDQFQPFVRDAKERGKPLTEIEAFDIAKSEAERRGHDVGDYKKPSILHKDGKWVFLFESNGPEPICLGCHFGITIDERKDIIFYSPGR